MNDTRPPDPQLRRALALLAGAALLVWPAFLNHYPIVFSDTHAYLVQAGQPRMVWDKPWIYGPFLLALHGNTTLWLPLAAQGLILSHLLRLLAPSRHLVLCAFLAAGSAAPWFAALLLPDIFAPITVLALYLLAFRTDLGIWQRRWLHGLAAFAIATHLTHLIIAGACLAVIALRRWRRLPSAALPLAIALALLLATNLAGYGRLAISPFGAVFALARLSADGLVEPVLARACPGAGWHLCDWTGRLPADSNDFLWSGDGPVWTAPGGPAGLAPEAAAIVARTLRENPLGVLRAAAGNTLTQLTMVRLGDTLGPDWLATSITGSLNAYFPPEERARLAASGQFQGQLAQWATPLNPVHIALLLLATPATLLLLRRQPLAAMVLAALIANAFATGALSGPHPRYQARLAWLILLPPGLLLLEATAPARPRPSARRAAAAPAQRSRPQG